MLGRKHSLNVATAGGVVIYELLRKYRAMLDSTRISAEGSRPRAYCPGGTAATTGIVTMLLVNTFCAIYNCVNGLVGSALLICNCTCVDAQHMPGASPALRTFAVVPPTCALSTVGCGQIQRRPRIDLAR